MASIRIRTRKDGRTYSSVLYRHNGKQASTSFDDPAAALKFKNLVEQVGADQAQQIVGIEQVVTAELTVNEWLTQYIDALTGVEEATQNRYRSYLNRDIDPVMGALPLSAVTETTIARWVQSLKGSGKTVANKHGFVSGAMNAAVRGKLIASNPCEGRRLPSHDRDEMVFLTPDEFKLLCEHMTERWRPLATWLITTGTRFSEATALKVGDINPVDHTCRISRAWKYTGTNTPKLGPPKSKKSRRTINIPPQALEAADVSGRPHGDWLFSTRNGTPIRAQLFHNKAWRPALAAATAEDASPRLLKRPRPHDLRHSCASWMIAAGVPLPVIQQHLGHESITTTIGTYGHLDRTSAQQASAAINAALGGI